MRTLNLAFLLAAVSLAAAVTAGASELDWSGDPAVQVAPDYASQAATLRASLSAAASGSGPLFQEAPQQAGGLTPRIYETLGGYWEQGTLPDPVEFRGGWTGRCFPPDPKAPAVRNSLLLVLPEPAPDDTGPLFSSLRASAARMGEVVSGKRSPGFFDDLSEPDERRIMEHIALLNYFDGTPVPSTDALIYDFWVTSRISVKQWGPYLLMERRHYGNITARCYYFRKVMNL